MTAPDVVAIGAANVDIHGRSASGLLNEESNPGAISLCAGGVARNIAENLARLGVSVELISAIGGDHFGQIILDSCSVSGVGVEHCAVDATLSSSGYVAILDERGEMALAVCDMDSTDRLITPAFLSEKAELIKSAKIIVVDAGLTRETIAYIAEHFGDKKLYLDPVSIMRCANIEGLVSAFHTIKMNGHEAVHLSGFRGAPARDDYIRMAGEFLARGNRTVFITLGVDGVVYAAQNEAHGWIPSVNVQVKGASGAGDAFTAGVVYAELQGMSMREAARFATGMSALTLESVYTASPTVSVEAAHEMTTRLPA